MRKVFKRDCVSLVDTVGYVDLPTACVRANETGFFGLSQRVAPESFDGKDTNIDPRQCFFGGRRIDLAIAAQNAEDYAAKSAGDRPNSDVGSDSAGDSQD